MHGKASAADRLVVVSYGFFTVLLMCLMRLFVPESQRSTQRHGRRT
jgi:hypothetical protein